jgi:hypothetical protein
MEAATYSLVLRRTGVVLLVVGLLDIGVLIYCIANGISYSSSFNIFAVIAGVFLLRGSLRAASVVRWLSVFMLAAFLMLIVAWPFVQPWDLTVTEVRLSPWSASGTIALVALVLGLLAWLYFQLGSTPVLATRAAAGRPNRDMRIPAVVGVALVVVLTVFLSVFLGGESGSKAKSIAAQQLGEGYRYHVSSLNIQMNNRGKFVSSVVTAWNDKEIRNIPVRWEER